jgi:hypothetical protein
MKGHMNLQEAKRLINQHPDQFYTYLLKRPDGIPFYVGKGNCKGFRIGDHIKEALQNKGINRYKINVIRKIIESGGQVDYEIVSFVDDEKMAFDKEAELINLYGRAKDGGVLTNLTDGGEGFCGGIHSKESRKKISDAARNSWQDLECAKKRKETMHKPRSEEAKRNMREAANRPEVKEKKSKAMIGKPSPMTNKHHSKDTIVKIKTSHIGLPSPMTGKHHTEASKEQMRITRRKNGYTKHTEEALLKMRKPRSEKGKANMRGPRGPQKHPRRNKLLL